MMITAPTVLVVDDEDDLRLLTCMQLRLGGFEVTEVNSGDAALRAIAATRPDAVVLDLRMPEIDGWTVLERLQSMGWLAELPVVVVSAHVNDDDANRVIAIGGRAVLHKPWEAEQLVASVRGVLVA